MQGNDQPKDTIDWLNADYYDLERRILAHMEEDVLKAKLTKKAGKKVKSTMTVTGRTKPLPEGSYTARFSDFDVKKGGLSLHIEEVAKPLSKYTKPELYREIEKLQKELQDLRRLHTDHVDTLNKNHANQLANIATSHTAAIHERDLRHAQQVRDHLGKNEERLLNILFNLAKKVP